MIMWKQNLEKKQNYIIWIQVYGPHKSGRHLRRYCEKSWTKIWTSNYELERLLPAWKNKEVIGLMKNKLDGKIRQSFETKNI